MRKLLWITLGVWGLATGFQWEAARMFGESPRLWYEPVLASSVCGGFGAVIGLYLVINRMTWTGLALTQTSGVGIFLAFFALSFLPPSEPLHHFLPLVMGGSAGLVTLLFFIDSQDRLDRGLLTAVFYVGAAAFVLILGDRVVEGHHEIESFLFGNAVAVGHHDFGVMMIAGSVMGGVLVWKHKHFTALSLDGNDYQVSGYRRRRDAIALYALLAAGITLSMKTVGQLPVLGFLVFPVATAVRTSGSFRDTWRKAVFLGFISGPMGYYISYLYSLPTGASMVAVGLFYYSTSFWNVDRHLK